MAEETRKYALPGSKAHYAPSLAFTVSHMRLSIEPDFKAQSISCDQELEVTAIQDTDSIELDATELDIKSVSMSGKKLSFRIYDDKVSIKLAKPLN